jgi:hypothetical protein
MRVAHASRDFNIKHFAALRLARACKRLTHSFAAVSAVHISEKVKPTKCSKGKKFCHVRSEVTNSKKKKGETGGKAHDLKAFDTVRMTFECAENVTPAPFDSFAAAAGQNVDEFCGKDGTFCMRSCFGFASVCFMFPRVLQQ